MARKKKNKTAPSEPSFLAVDFFCGAGGTTRGLIDAGGYVIAGIDKDARCERTFVENNANTAIDHCLPRFLERDIFPAGGDYPDGRQEDLFTDLEDLIPFYRSRAKTAPLLFAICAPCQPRCPCAMPSAICRPSRRARPAGTCRTTGREP